MGKDLNGTELGAGIYRRKDGRYEARIRIKGTQKSHSIYDTNLRKLKQKKKQFIASIPPGDFNVSFSMTVSKWFEIYLRTYAQQKLKQKTLNNYVRGFERVEDHIGYMKIIDVKNIHIVMALQELQKEGYATSTIQQSLSVLRQVFLTAFQNHIILYNPCADYQYTAPPEQFDETPAEDLIMKKPLQALSTEVLQRFFSYMENRRYYELFIVLLHTGLRVGELTSLQWKDVDFSNKVLKIYKTLEDVTDVFDKEGNRLLYAKSYSKMTSPKSKNGYRFVPLSDTAIKALESWKERQEADKRKYGRDWGCSNPLAEQYPDLVCTTGPGNPLKRGWLDRLCKNFEEKTNRKEIELAAEEERTPNLIKITPHIFRHTYVTNLIKANVPASVIKNYVGHKAEDMVEYYTHLDELYVMGEVRAGMKNFYSGFDRLENKLVSESNGQKHDRAK